MKTIYIVRDNKAGNYFDPMFFPHLTALMRMLSEVVADPKTTLAKYPQDYEVYELGTFDDSTGDMDLLPNPKFILNVTELVQQQKVSA